MYVYIYIFIYIFIYIYIYVYISGADPAFVIRSGLNSVQFLSNLRKLLKRGKFFLITQSLIVKRN